MKVVVGKTYDLEDVVVELADGNGVQELSPLSRLAVLEDLVTLKIGDDEYDVELHADVGRDEKYIYLTRWLAECHGCPYWDDDEDGEPQCNGCRGEWYEDGLCNTTRIRTSTLSDTYDFGSIEEIEACSEFPQEIIETLKTLYKYGV